MPQISVIIPAYNCEKTIRQTIESVLKQTFTDFELIVINDGSQDATLDIISSIKDPRIKIYSYPNAGVSASRDRGVTQASGEFIAFLDADDLWTPNKLESQLKLLQDNPLFAVAYSWTDYIDESGQLLYTGSHITLNGDIYQHILVHNFIENGSNALIRKEALSEVGNFDKSLLGFGEDWDFLIRLAARYHFVAFPQAQVLYRMSADSSSSSILKQEQGCLKVIEKSFCQAPKSLQYLKKYSLANLYKYLTFRTLVGSLERQKAIIASRCFWNAVRHNPALLYQHLKLMSIVFVKIMAGILLPDKWLQALLGKLKASE